MYKTISFLTSIATATLLVTATAAQAATPASAGLSEASSERVHIARRTVWVCDDTSCTTQDTNSRASHECTRLAREVGTLTSFTVGGEAFTEEELAACNASAS